jgi:hypothetical protein
MEASSRVSGRGRLVTIDAMRKPITVDTAMTALVVDMQNDFGATGPRACVRSLPGRATPQPRRSRAAHDTPGFPVTGRPGRGFKRAGRQGLPDDPLPPSAGVTSWVEPLPSTLGARHPWP